MKLVLGNDFTWDGVYPITDENGSDKFMLVAEIENNYRTLKLFTKEAYDNATEPDGESARMDTSAVGNSPMQNMRYKTISTEYGLPIAEVEQKAAFSKSKYALSERTRVIGNIVRRYNDQKDPYDIEINDWFVSGAVYSWNFIIVDKFGEIARSAVMGDRLALDYVSPESTLRCALMLAALSALAHDLRNSEQQRAAGKKLSEREPLLAPTFLEGEGEGSGYTEALGMIRDGVEKVNRFTDRFKKK